MTDSRKWLIFNNNEIPHFAIAPFGMTRWWACRKGGKWKAAALPPLSTSPLFTKIFTVIPNGAPAK